MKKLLITMLCSLCCIAGCSLNREKEIGLKQNSYKSISAQEAKVMMDEQKEVILLDVRSQEEFDEGHIKDAILIPDTKLSERANQELIDKNATILIYCRSGRRSKQAAKTLEKLGYTQLFEFGGIIDWPYEIVK